MSSLALLGLACLVSLALAAGCGSTKQHDYRELREYALDDSISLEERSQTLMRMASDESESTHLRGVAIQMLGILQVEEAQPIMLNILGKVDDAERREEPAEANDNAHELAQPEAETELDREEEAARAELAESPWLMPDRDTQPAESELLRMEAVIALGRFAEPELYDQVLRLIYEEGRDPSPMVIRQFVQSFSHAEAFPDPQAVATAETLLRWMRIAIDRNEDESMVHTALHDLRRLAHRPDLMATDISEWEAHLRSLRRGELPAPIAPR